MLPLLQTLPSPFMIIVFEKFLDFTRVCVENILLATITYVNSPVVDQKSHVFVEELLFK